MLAWAIWLGVGMVVGVLITVFGQFVFVKSSEKAFEEGRGFARSFGIGGGVVALGAVLANGCGFGLIVLLVVWLLRALGVLS